MTQQSTPGPTFRKDENPNSKRHIHLNVHCCTIYNSQDIEAICVQRQMNGSRRCGSYIQWNISHKKNKILPLAATGTDLEMIILYKIRESQIYDITSYMWNLKNNSNELIYKTK